MNPVLDKLTAALGELQPHPCRRDYGTPIVAHVNASYYRVSCPICGYSVIGPAEREAIATWNSKNTPRRSS